MIVPIGNPISPITLPTVAIIRDHGVSRRKPKPLAPSKAAMTKGMISEIIKYTFIDFAANIADTISAAGTRDNTAPTIYSEPTPLMETSV